MLGNSFTVEAHFCRSGLAEMDLGAQGRLGGMALISPVGHWKGLVAFALNSIGLS